MNEIVKLSEQDAKPKVEDMIRTASDHRYSLDEWSSNRQSVVLSTDVSAQILGEVTSVLSQDCTPNQAATAFSRLMACYPQPVKGPQEAADAYATIMMEEMQRFPLPVLRQVLPEFYRTHTFRPSVAEICIACQEELDKLKRYRRGLERMEAFRAQEQKKRDEAKAAREKAEAYAAEQDDRAVECFGADGVCPGDYAGADRTFQMIPSVGQAGFHSAWMRWNQLLRRDEWPPWLSTPMRLAGIFGRAELAVRRGQATIDQLEEICDALFDVADQDVRGLLDKIEAAAIKNAGPCVEQALPVPRVVLDMVWRFDDLLNAPITDQEVASANNLVAGEFRQ